MGSCGRAVRPRGRRYSAIRRRVRRPVCPRSKPSSKSAGKEGEILGCIGDRPVADSRAFDTAPAGVCCKRSGHAGVWWGSGVECVSALALDQRAETLALDRLNQLASGWHEVDPTDLVRETAMRFLRVHPLRAADALQLAAAFIAAEQRPASLEMLTF